VQCALCTDFEITTDQLQNQSYFQEVYCNSTDHRFYTICGVAIHILSLNIFTENNIDFVTSPL